MLCNHFTVYLLSSHSLVKETLVRLFL